MACRFSLHLYKKAADGSVYGHEEDKYRIEISTLRHLEYRDGATVVLALDTYRNSVDTGQLQLFTDNLDMIEELQEKLHEFLVDARMRVIADKVDHD
jgi:hypothetical protein